MMDSVEILVFICLIHIMITKGGGGNTETISIFNRTALQRGCVIKAEEAELCQYGLQITAAKY